MSEQTPTGWLVPAAAQRLEGTDVFTGLSATVLEFWRWGFSDLRDNTVRGVLAEFLVAAALDRTDQRRKGWDNVDVISKTGIRVEVKASGYLQSWAQARHSALSFGRVAARSWNEHTNQLGAEVEVRADVFVFAVQTCKEHDRYDALDIGQWEFYVVAAGPVRDSGFKSLSIAWVARHATPVAYGTLAAEIHAVHDAASGQL